MHHGDGGRRVLRVAESAFIFIGSSPGPLRRTRTRARARALDYNNILLSSILGRGRSGASARAHAFRLSLRCAPGRPPARPLGFTKTVLGTAAASCVHALYTHRRVRRPGAVDFSAPRPFPYSSGGLAAPSSLEVVRTHIPSLFTISQHYVSLYVCYYLLLFYTHRSR